jgi:hypothetical protein
VQGATGKDHAFRADAKSPGCVVIRRGMQECRFYSDHAFASYKQVFRPAPRINDRSSLLSER